jgi:hypothetical protein
VWKVRQPLSITSACPKPTLLPFFIKPKVACGPPNRAPRATGEPPLRKVGCSEYELLPLALPSALHGRYHLSPQRSLDPFFVRRCGVGFGRVALTSASRPRIPRALRCCGGYVADQQVALVFLRPRVSESSSEWREGTLTAGESCGTVSRGVKFRNGVVAGRGEGVRPTPVFR